MPNCAIAMTCCVSVFFVVVAVFLSAQAPPRVPFQQNRGLESQPVAIMGMVPSTPAGRTIYIYFFFSFFFFVALQQVQACCMTQSSYPESRPRSSGLLDSTKRISSLTYCKYAHLYNRFSLANDRGSLQPGPCEGHVPRINR